MTQFPRTDVAGISLPRMLIGTNWVFIKCNKDNIFRMGYTEIQI